MKKLRNSIDVDIRDYQKAKEYNQLCEEAHIRMEHVVSKLADYVETKAEEVTKKGLRAEINKAVVPEGAKTIVGWSMAGIRVAMNGLAAAAWRWLIANILGAWGS